MDFKKMTSPCGMDCFNCPAYFANEDTNMRADISEKLKVPLEAAACKGCRIEKGTISILGDNSPCEIFKCTNEKAVTYCFECPDFPCDHLHPYADKATERPHNTKLFNLCMIKKLGVNQWAIDKASKVRQTYFNGILRVHAVDKK